MAATQPGPYWPRTTSASASPGVRRDRPQDLDLLVPQGVGLEASRRLHGHQADQLEEVVLEDVARGAGLLVERAPVLDADRFGHRDLDVVDVAPIPERLEDAVAEPEDQQVTDGLLAQVVVDAVDLRLAEDLADLPVEPPGRIGVVPERLLDDDPPPAAVVVLVIEPGAAELAGDLGELRGLGRQVVQPVAPGPALLVEPVEAGGQRVEAGRIGEVEVLVADPPGERRPGILLDRQDAAELVQRAANVCAERFVVVRSPADRQEDELVRQQVRAPQLEERRDHLSVGEVAGAAEQDEDGRVRDALEPEALAEDVLERPGPGSLAALAGQPELLHRARRFLGARPRTSGDRLVGRRFNRRRIRRHGCRPGCLGPGRDHAVIPS